MLYSITIEDMKSAPLPSGVLTFLDKSGKTITTKAAGANGVVIIDDEMDGGLLDALVTVRATAPGYYDSQTPGSDIVPGTYFQLQKAPNYTPYIVGGLGLGLMGIAVGQHLKRRGRMGAAAAASASGGIDLSKYVVPAGVVILGAAIVLPKLREWGLLPSAADQAKTAAQSAAADAQKNAGLNVTGTRNMSNADVSALASNLTDTTSSFFYDYKGLIDQLARFAQMAGGDAQLFLSQFVQTNSYTLYQWWLDKFYNSWNLNAGGLFSHASAYHDAFYSMGVPDNYVSMGPDNFVLACVRFVYSIAGESMQ